MNPLIVEPTDVLFFRDAVPMSAGQGKGAGCRLPFPSTLHEAFRSTLLRLTGEHPDGAQVEGRPRAAERSGNWHAAGHDLQTFIATRAFRSLRTVGPLPFIRPDGPPIVWQERHCGRETGVQVHYTGLLLPVPADAAFETREKAEAGPDGVECRWPDRPALRRLELWRDPDVPSQQTVRSPSDYRPLCLPLATTPPDKHGPLAGWWSVSQYRAYLDPAGSPRAREDNTHEFFRPLPTTDLWQAEHRVGVQIDPASFAAADSQLYAGSYLRPDRLTHFLAWAEIADPAKASNGEAAARQRERQHLDALDWLMLGGEFRIARLRHRTDSGGDIPDPLGDLRNPPAPLPGDGPCLLKWVLITPAIFAHGSLPGWCADTAKARSHSPLPVGRVCLDLPGRAHLVSWCVGKPRTVSGWDLLANDGRGAAKPTLLAVPEGGVYWFLCENRPTAAALARKLHWQPRADYYGEKGCGYGLVSFDARLHSTSEDVRTLANHLFNP
jgi:CRISPR type III-B/RAMP module-associated protein Cmr3